jgi:predicted RNase H-like HicB family nuclease
VTRTYHIDMEPDPDGRYTATIREFGGCITEGNSCREALDRILGLAPEWLAVCDESSLEIPEPTEDQTA